MKNLFTPSIVEEILTRVENLSPQSKAQWGKMDVAQMLCHCAGGMKIATGDLKLPRVFLGRILGPLMKSVYYNNRPFPKSIQTDKALVIKDKKDFEEEKAALIYWVKVFHEGGAEKCTSHPHPFLGHFTPEQWAMGMYKHLDHHFRQFGV